MLIGHLPAGYLAATTARSAGAGRVLFWAILLGSVLPDIDMLWFLFVDGGSTHHHHYLTHRPIVWIALIALGALLRSKLALGIGLGGVLHVALDTIAGQIAWGWPLSPSTTTLVVVPVTHEHWIGSFVNHWTFQVEIGIALAAICVFLFRSFRRS